MRDETKGGIIFMLLVLVVLLLIFGGIAGCVKFLPEYRVYQQSMEGKAAFAKAESDRQIKVLEAQATLDSADKVAEAERKRAQGVADANRIIADGLGGPEGYLRWRYIEMLENSNENRQVIYVPTEAGLPVLEAGRLKNND